MMGAPVLRKIAEKPFRTVDRLILASASPRRRRFLEGLGLDFQIKAADVDESPAPGELPEEFVLRIAAAKEEAIGVMAPDAWVLGADTVVVLDNGILGKPRDEDDARAMLLRLSGRQHEVWTGFSLSRKSSGDSVRRAVRTEVRFVSLTGDLCRAYVKTGEPLDKAGSYGIQGMGGFLVESITGSYSNVVGLPLSEVVMEMLRLGVIAPLAE